MTQPEYTIHVCPICGEQAWDSDDYGWTTCCDHGSLHWPDPIEIPVEVAADPAKLSARLAVERFRCDQERREQDWEKAERVVSNREYQAMSREERIEKYGVVGVTMREMMNYTPILSSLAVADKRPTWGSIEIPVQMGTVKPDDAA